MGEAPEGWPGRLWLDGRTPVNVGDFAGQAVESRGPKSKSEIPVFHNSAMTGSRTRSVLLLDQCLSENWITKPEQKLRALDGLAASAVRARRWLSEIPTQNAARLRITAVDASPRALEWAQANHQEFPPLPNSSPPDSEFPHHSNGLRFLQGDLRARVLEAGWQWVDLDPFGPPTPFLDTVMQGLARKAVVEVTATDTAALCGAAADSAKRRYGSIGVVDDLRHDTAMRILLGHVATIAARHDRAIEPLMCIFDDHHIRVSVLCRKSKEDASDYSDNIGWRFHSPTEEEISRSCAAGLHPAGMSEDAQISALLPWDDGPSKTNAGRISGPLWTGKLGRSDVYSAMNAERSEMLCSLDEERDHALIAKLEISAITVKDSKRLAKKAVRGLAEVAEAIEISSTYPVDMIASQCTDISGPPSPIALAELLRQKGWRAAKDFIAVPAVRTDAPWDVVMAAVRQIAPGN